MTPLYFKMTVICEYSIDFHETFTDGLKFMEVLGMQNLVNTLELQKLE